jgi:hypothetical protein
MAFPVPGGVSRTRRRFPYPAAFPVPNGAPVAQRRPCRPAAPLSPSGASVVSSTRRGAGFALKGGKRGRPLPEGSHGRGTPGSSLWKADNPSRACADNPSRACPEAAGAEVWRIPSTPGWKELGGVRGRRWSPTPIRLAGADRGAIAVDVHLLAHPALRIPCSSVYPWPRHPGGPTRHFRRRGRRPLAKPKPAHNRTRVAAGAAKATGAHTTRGASAARPHGSTGWGATT